MDAFEFLFSLFGLLLGLSLAEILHGFGKAVKARSRVRIGWLAPLLGLLVMVDVISFWDTAWAMRETLPLTYLTFLGMLVFAGAYYLAASLVFPEDAVAGTDYDQHYWANKKLVVAAVAALNLPLPVYDLVSQVVTGGNTAMTLIIMPFFFGLLAALFFARTYRLNLILLIASVALYPTFALIGPLLRGWVAGS